MTMRKLVVFIFLLGLTYSMSAQEGFDFDFEIDSLNEDAETLYLKCQVIVLKKYGKIQYNDSKNKTIYAKRILKPLIADRGRNKILFEHDIFLVADENKIRVVINNFRSTEKAYKKLPVFRKKIVVESMTNSEEYLNEKYNFIFDEYDFYKNEYNTLMNNLFILVLEEIEEIKFDIQEPLMRIP